MNLIARYHAWQQKRRTREIDQLIDAVALARVTVFVEPHLSVMNRRAEDYENGHLYRCVYCGKLFIHDDRHSAYGYCIECS